MATIFATSGDDSVSLGFASAGVVGGGATTESDSIEGVLLSVDK